MTTPTSDDRRDPIEGHGAASDRSAMAELLQRALTEGDGALPGRNLEVTDAELTEYREAHAPKRNRR